jgi:transposase
MTTRKPYPSDVSDEEWVFVALYLELLREDAPQRTHELREVFNGLHFVAFACLMVLRAIDLFMVGP